MFKCFTVFFLFTGTCILQGQARATATRNAEGQIGGSYINGYADYTLSRFNGIGAYADLDFRHGIGVEAEYHHITDLDPNYLIYQTTYEVGGRYSRHYGRFQPYAKVMVGRGNFNFPAPGPNPDYNYSYNLYAFGFGVDIRAYRRINVRAEDEFQQWLPGSGAAAAFIPNGLSPNLPTLGIAYRFK